MTVDRLLNFDNTDGFGQDPEVNLLIRQITDHRSVEDMTHMRENRATSTLRYLKYSLSCQQGEAHVQRAHQQQQTFNLCLHFFIKYFLFVSQLIDLLKNVKTKKNAWELFGLLKITYLI